MTPSYNSTAPYSEDNYVLVWKQPAYSDTSTGVRKFAPSIFDYEVVKVNDYSLTSNNSRGCCAKYENRLERRKERALAREKPRLSKRRHKHAK